MKTLILFIIIVVIISKSGNSQGVSINLSGTPADSSAILDISSTNKGILIPRLTTIQRTNIQDPADGLLVFDLNLHNFLYYSINTWIPLKITNTLADADGDTKIQLEEIADEDILRVDLSGVESLVLLRNGNGDPIMKLKSGEQNILFGKEAGAFNTGYENVVLGDSCFVSNTSGYANTSIGYNSLNNNINGWLNTAIGNNALYANTSGITNSAIGSASLISNTLGNGNTAHGWNALHDNTEGHSNTAIGKNAMYFNISGIDNTALGISALYFNNTGNYNTAVGRNALLTNWLGHYNTAIGANTNVTADNFSNATVLGAQALVNASNKVRIGNSSVTVIEGQVDWSFPSDGRFKYNINSEDVPGLNFINKLRPVTYQFNKDLFEQHLNSGSSGKSNLTLDNKSNDVDDIIQTGFIAQEVEKICSELNFTFSGLHIPSNETDNYSLAYGSFVPLLVKAIQEQQIQIEQLKLQYEQVEKFYFEQLTMNQAKKGEQPLANSQYFDYAEHKKPS